MSELFMQCELTVLHNLQEIGKTGRLTLLICRTMYFDRKLVRYWYSARGEVGAPAFVASTGRRNVAERTAQISGASLCLSRLSVAEPPRAVGSDFQIR